MLSTYPHQQTGFNLYKLSESISSIVLMFQLVALDNLLLNKNVFFSINLIE